MDYEQKKNGLFSLQDEVNDFHPLLDELFKNMDGIDRVEHTHGNSEMGADFVLYKKNEMFAAIDHIGVIVKLGTIKQDNTDVERQIEECSVERTFSNGKEKGYLNEIWVVTNCNITQNAKRKITEKHKNSKINYVDCELLCQWIDKFFPMYWDEMPVEVGSYITKEIAACREEDIKLSLIDNVPNAYIEQEIVKNNRDKYYNNWNSKRKFPKEEIVNIYNEISNNDCLIIEGEMGAGKSKLLRKIFEHYCEVSVFKNELILPFRVQFSEYMNIYDGDPVTFMDNCLKGSNIKIDDVKTFLILIDGVDEYKSGEDSRVEFLEIALSRLVYSYKDTNLKFIFATRDIYPTDVYNYVKNTNRYSIKPLNGAKLYEFLCKICDKLTNNDRLLEDLKKSELFKELPNYPMSAILLAKLINEGEYKDLPMTITELYKKYTELCLGRWDMSRNLESELEYKVSTQFVLNVAQYMFENKVLTITYDQSKNIYNEYISKRNFAQLNNDTLYLKIIERTGVFVKDEFGNLSFKHRTFLSYFYAQYMHERNKSIFDYNVLSPEYHDITLFYIGIQNDCLDVLTRIVRQDPKDDFERFYKPLAIADYFLAGYATEYDVVKDNMGKIFVDVSVLYRDIVSKKIVVPFSVLSETQILWLFQALLRDKYSYVYFKKAFSECCYDIQGSNCDDYIKAIAFFLIGCINVELGESEPFEYLIEFQERNIPESAKYIVLNEAKTIGTYSDKLKRLTKRIKKDMQKSNIKYRDIIQKPLMLPSKVQKEIMKSE